MDPLIRMEGRAPSPPRRHLAMELRAPFEFAAFRISGPLFRRLPRGDGHPVLVLPGFLGADDSTNSLRKALRGKGFWVHGWGQGRNLGPAAATMDGLRLQLAAIHKRHGRRVSLLGYSMGGLMARALAREFPDTVRSLVMLSSPFRFRPGDSSSVLDIYAKVNARWPNTTIDFDDIPELDEDHLLGPLAMPSTSIYSRSDGMIRSRLCLEAKGLERENVAVVGSHIGMPWNPAAFLVMVDRLAQGEGEWKKFRPPRVSRALFPAPDWWEAPPTHEIGSTISG